MVLFIVRIEPQKLDFVSLLHRLDLENVSKYLLRVCGHSYVSQMRAEEKLNKEG